MKKENLLFGVIAILGGTIVGFIGTDYLNKSNSPQNSADRPAAPAETQAPASQTGSGDLMAVIEQARQDPGNFDAQMKAGGMYREIKRFEQALTFYQNAATARPSDTEANVKLADTLFDLQRFEEAAGSYQKALQLDPQNATVRMDLGLTWFLRTPRDLDRAIAEFRTALTIDPRHEKALQNLTAALLEKGDKAAASKTIQQLAAVNPGNASLSAFKTRLGE
ncbi:MAG: hypothetical protein RIR86_1687 [Acidobacteriota bacterium]|jgi:tetratricopeptide (TPR) repeat protein